jgi:hypothetical protein
MMNLEDSNKFVIDLITKLNNEKIPFVISRYASEGAAAYNLIIKNIFNIPNFLSINGGIYSSNPQDIKKYYFAFFNSIEKSDGMAIFETINIIKSSEDYFTKVKKIPALTYQVLEPFYCILNNIKPWTHYLEGKKILIVSPFVESFKKQLANGFRLFKDENNNIFRPNQEFVFYKCFNTAGGNHLHSSWIETFTIMCNDIAKLDFDFVLLSCGGYGMPLTHFIKKKLNKSSVYVGGGLQLFFGIIVKRWETSDVILKIINENGCKFIKPSEDEKIKNLGLIENGCYW